MKGFRIAIVTSMAIASACAGDDSTPDADATGTTQAADDGASLPNTTDDGDVATDSSPILTTSADDTTDAGDTSGTDDTTDDGPPPRTCGDGVVEQGEDCDGDNLDGATCRSLRFEGGELTCARDCEFDLSQCIAPRACGNGVVEADEACDGRDLDEQTCQTLRHDGGTLQCARDCTFDESQCWDVPPVCGDGVVEGDEACDGDNLDGETCVSQGFTGGVLYCTANCQFNTGSCGNDMPAEWTCLAPLWDDGICDCGCGVVDVDCPNSTVGACESCIIALWGGCSNSSACPANIDPNDNATCQ